MTESTEYLQDHLVKHFGKDTDVIALRGAGWSERIHIEADILVGSEKMDLFLKWMRPQGQTAEIYAYDHILPLLSIRTPHFYGSFPDYEYPTRWLILERLNGRPVRRDRQDDIIPVFHILGSLHGQGKAHPPLCSQDTEHLRFPKSQIEGDPTTIKDTLAANLEELCLDRKVPEAFDQCMGYLCAAPKTWIHGDNDGSNILLHSDGVRLIDWEALSWAPPAVGLGNFCARMPASLIKEGLYAYRRGYCEASGEKMLTDKVQEWICHGVFFHGARWLSRHCQRVHNESWRREWFRTVGVSLVEAINQLIAQGELDSTG